MTLHSLKEPDGAPGIDKPDLRLNPSGEVSISFIVGVVRKWWWLVAICSVLAVLGAVLVVANAERKYTVSIEVVEAKPTSPLAGAGALAALSGLGLGSSTDSDMELYLHLIKTIEVAERIAAEPELLKRMFPHLWDSASQTWREPPVTVTQWIKNAIKYILSVDSIAWRPPAARETLTYLTDNIRVRGERGSPVTVIEFEHHNPEFARDLLLFLHETADGILRARAITRADLNIQYLTKELSTVTVAEHRIGLIQALSDQEKRRMAANSGAAFAAEIFSGPVMSQGPTTPKPNRILLVFLAIGIVVPAGALLVIEYARAMKRQNMN